MGTRLALLASLLFAVAEFAGADTSCLLSNGAAIHVAQGASDEKWLDANVTVTVRDGAVALGPASIATVVSPRRAEWHVHASNGNQQLSTVADSAIGGTATRVSWTCNTTAATASAVISFTEPSVVATIRFSGDDGTPFVAMDVTVSGDGANAVMITRAEPWLLGAPIYGLGTQYNTLDLRGWRLPVFTREQGVGRGEQPITRDLNAGGAFVGGSYATTYGARPVFIGQRTGAVFALRNSELSVFHFGASDVDVTVNATSVHGLLWAPSSANNGSNPLAAGVSALATHVTGLPRKLAPWAYNGGAIVGMQGGTAAVLSNLTALEALGCPISAFWLQDWTGVRQLSMRQGLWWNWRWSEQHYPGHQSMIATLRSKAIEVLTYINPMLADCGAAANCSGGVNLFQEALDKGFLVRHGPSDALWRGYNDAAMVDLTIPAARKWFARDVVAHAYSTGVSGFMADFGEAYPLDANTTRSSVDGRPVAAAAMHNAFPDVWFDVARDGTKLANVSASDSFFFGRSAWLHSAASYSSAWQGDQLCSWDANDGLASAVASLLAGGVSGTPFTHSDIGGYNAVTDLGYRRTEELFYRWCELAAFTTTMRTHDGSNPHANWQLYSSNASRAEFTRNVRVYKALYPVRAALVAVAEATGLPVVRPVLMAFRDADVDVFGNMTQQFALGSIVVAPVVRPNVTRWSVTLPVAATVRCWANLWEPADRRQASASTSHLVVSSYAPVGCAPAWFPCADLQARDIAMALESAGLSQRCRE